MCRMMAIVGGSAPIVEALLGGFREQARESRVGGDPQTHPDGWGVAALTRDGPHLVASSTRPIWEDLAFGALVPRLVREGNPGLLLHARQASRGRVRLENCHPFVRAGWAFAHNGTVDDDWADVESQAHGDTDSERAFLRALERGGATGFPEALASTLAAFGPRDFTSLTVLAASRDRLIAYRRLGQLETGGCGATAEEYGLFRARCGDAWILAQEETHLPPLSKRENLSMERLHQWKIGPQATAPWPARSRNSP